MGLVESAIARPYNGYYRSIAQKAAALVESVAKNHGFADGNKRTALILVATLIERSGYKLTPAEREDFNEAAEEMLLGVVTGRMPLPDIEEWFKDRIRRA